MKFKKLICMGMAVILACSNLPQITVQAQQIQEEAVRDIQTEEEMKNPEEFSLAQQEEETEQRETIRRKKVAREGTKEEPSEEEMKQQELQNLEIETEDVKEVTPNQERQWYENFQYQELADGTLKITDYRNNHVKELIIPAEIEGKQVCCIGDYTFASCNSLSSISFPEGVTSIGYGHLLGAAV